MVQEKGFEVRVGIVLAGAMVLVAGPARASFSSHVPISSMSRERQREGIAIARLEGKYRGRKPSLTPARAAELRRRVADGNSKAALAREFGISRDTLYRYVPVKKRRAGKLAK
nr:helix-turn-helix domain-containing protein [Edaphobacter modestus]